MSDDSSDFWSSIDAASARSPADVVRSDEVEPMAEEDFDDAVWLSIFDRVDSTPDFRALPQPVRLYFATRFVEWEVGNGGFAQALECAGAYFDEAIEGYEALGDTGSARLLARAHASMNDQRALEALDAEVEGPPWNGAPWSDSVRVAYVRANRDAFRLE